VAVCDFCGCDATAQLQSVTKKRKQDKTDTDYELIGGTLTLLCC
jgi:hypothetical protein